jgi:diguanylate cyclase (GGDEF)-like protein
MPEMDALDIPSEIEVHQVIRQRVAWITLAAVLASLGITALVNYVLNGALPNKIGFTIAVLAPLVIAPVASYANISLSYRLQLANKRLQALSETDPLTQTLNRRKFMEVAERELALAERHCYPTSVVLIDFDDFKQVNDRYGHAAGDHALVSTINVMKEMIRESDILARFGGEEFILLLPHTVREGAHSLAKRMLERVAAAIIEVEEGQLNITLSAGVVTCETSRTPLDVMMSRADELLYESKQNGRNRCTSETLINRVPQYRRA